MAFSRALAALSILAPIALIACTTGPAGDDELGAACGNGKKDDAESDVDCGGACPTKCTALKGCLAATDCGGGFLCVKSVCAATTSTDGTKSGTETDVDCGGPTAPPCDVGAVCTNLADCADKVCIDGKCAPPGPSDHVKNG
ncbi:MAG TPA: hypothetical protein VM925_04685, partial [Labilithrix sp.]|nr:hypothetical protein [Labilithrix sp.]